MVLATASASLGSLTAPSVPGTSGTPKAFTASLAASLSPITSMAFGEGPTNSTPAFSRAVAKAPFSLRKPYPGCTASTFNSRHTSTSLSMRR